MTRLLFIASMFALGGCAVLSNVTPIGDGAFMTVVHSNDVNATAEGERARATSQATAFCKDRGASVEVIRLVVAAPPPGQPPSAEIDFRCKTAP
jgi:esterase/lipase superfamily enzyme